MDTPPVASEPAAKTMSARENFDGLHVWDSEERSRRMLKLVCFVYLVHLVCLV